MIITQHAQQRMRERCGLKKKSMEKLAQRAYDSGLTEEDIRGSARAWMAARKDRKGKSNTLKLYGDVLYIFAPNTQTLITVFPVPQPMVAQVRKQMAQREGKQN